MANKSKNPKVNAFILNAKKWQEEVSLLRSMLLDFDLVEELKWKQPCYTCEGNNMVIIATLKEYFALGFLKGALLTNQDGALTAPGKNSQAVRQLRFTSLDEVVEKEALIRVTIQEAIQVEKSGQKIAFKEKGALEYPDELIQLFKDAPALQKAFEALTPGRQRGYNLHFTGAKQSSTRTSRIEACRNKIMAGKGKDDCNCGLSKRMPRCDGSHKQLEN